MRLKIVGHPVKRMRQRGITHADIENAIRNHHTSHPADPGALTYVGPGMNGRDLKVWALLPGYVDDSTTVTIKSAAWKGI